MRGTQYSGLELDHQVIPGRGTVAAHQSLGDRSNEEDKFCILRDVTVTVALTFN